MADNEDTSMVLRGEPERSLADIASLILSARQLLDRRVAEGSFDHVDDALAALLEKAGALADRALERLGKAPTVGCWYEWAKVAAPDGEHDHG